MTKLFFMNKLQINRILLKLKKNMIIERVLKFTRYSPMQSDDI